MRPKGRPIEEDEIEQEDELEQELTTIDGEDEDKEGGYDDEQPLWDPEEAGR